MSRGVADLRNGTVDEPSALGLTTPSPGEASARETPARLTPDCAPAASGGDPAAASAQTLPLLAPTLPLLAQTLPLLAQTLPLLAPTLPLLAPTLPLLAPTLPLLAPTLLSQLPGRPPRPR